MRHDLKVGDHVTVTKSAYEPEMPVGLKGVVVSRSKEDRITVEFAGWEEGNSGVIYGALSRLVPTPELVGHLN